MMTGNVCPARLRDEVEIVGDPHESDDSLGFMFGLQRSRKHEHEPVVVYRCRHCGSVYIPAERSE